MCLLYARNFILSRTFMKFLLKGGDFDGKGDSS
nr:MAG TPA: hypothetical protein [Caudoviricetes sp.]